MTDAHQDFLFLDCPDYPARSLARFEPLVHRVVARRRRL